MKSSFVFLLSFVFFSAQAQYTVDWGKAPLNPTPDTYTLNHYRLSGKVTSFNDVLGKNIITFNDQGNAVSQVNEFDKTIWVYDSAGHLSQQKWGTDFELMVDYKTNEKGWVIQIIYDSGNIQNFKYDQNGLFISKADGDMPVVEYVYDDKGRVIKEDFFFGSYPIVTNTHEYIETSEGLTVVTTNIDRDTDETEILTQKYNKRGDVVFRNNKKREYEYDANGNILSSIGKDFPVKYEYIYANDKDNK